MIIIHKDTEGLVYVHEDDKDTLKEIYPNLKTGDILVSASQLYVADDEGYGEEYMEIKLWEDSLGLSEWVLDGGEHPLVTPKDCYAVFNDGNNEVWLLPQDSKTIFVDKQTGEILGESDFPCIDHTFGFGLSTQDNGNHRGWMGRDSNW